VFVERARKLPETNKTRRMATMASATGWTGSIVPLAMAGVARHQGVQVLAERVDELLAVPHDAEIISSRDTATVADLNRPGEVTARTAQHAVRQGRRAAHNLVI